jgi:predicted CXXCH cytochrome family protein
MKAHILPLSFITTRCPTRGAAIQCAAPGLRGGATARQPLSIAGKKAMKSRIPLLLTTFFLAGLLWSAVSFAADEPIGQGAVTFIRDISYFEMTVDYSKPDDAEGVLVVVRQSYVPAAPPVDGTVYTANSRIGVGDTTVAGCFLYCEYVVADSPASGSVTVTGLKDGINHYFAVYAYNGSGADINYNQAISATSAVTTSAGLISHNEMYVAGTANGDGTWTPAPETNEGCTYCHGAHHTSQLLPTQLDMANKCFTCHSATGSAAAKADVALHLADGRVDCGTCHSLHSFRKEELYSTNNRTNPPTKGFNKAFVRANMSKYINPTDYPPPGGGGTTTARDNTVFQNSTIFKFATPDPPTGYYNGVCQTCHTATRFYKQSASSNHQSGNYCMNCHHHKNADYYNAFLRSW